MPRTRLSSRTALPLAYACDVMIGHRVRHFGQGVEAAVYFSCPEALQDVAKYAEPSRATVTVSNGAGGGAGA